MRSWTTSAPPALPGRGLEPRLFDTSVGRAHNVTQVGQSKPASMYVCGITPYDATHLGHAATNVAFDVLNRVWRDAGHDVRYVQNVTDIDDPLFERANATEVAWRELADKETALFAEDMAWLNVLPPEDFVGAEEAIPLIIDLIERLAAAGATYTVEGDVPGDVYFAVHADASFGSVSGLDDATMRALFAERGGDPDRAGKKHPLDCLLWRVEHPGEPAWDSPFGRGRPGWHVECTAIALKYLGDGFDVQGGGNDLAFPHHEMCASEGHVATGDNPFALAYVHAGMVGLDGEKMSKSLGNLVFASQLRHDGRDPAAVRLALLSDHYRADRDWVDAAYDEAAARVAKWRAAVARGSGPEAAGVLASVRERLADDLDTPGALAAVDAWAAGSGDDVDAPSAVRDLVSALLGIQL